MGRKIKTEHTFVDIDDITEEDMPNDTLKEVFGTCGREVAVSLMEHQSGVFIMMPARPFLKLEQRLMIEEFDGSPASLRQVARKYNVSESRIRYIIRTNARKNNL